MLNEASRAVKQVIVMRTDLNMRKGKMIAQGAHAAGMCLVRRLLGEPPLDPTAPDALWDWIRTSFTTKICVRARDEAELLHIYQQALAAGLEAHLVTDMGFTEFSGVRVHTCVAIGPAPTDLVDAITGHLMLL